MSEPQSSESQSIEQRRVRVWFGEHVIADYVAEPERAARYAVAMDRRFAGLKITNDPVPSAPLDFQPLPSERLWDITPH